MTIGSLPALAEGTSFWTLVSNSVRASSAIENSILLFLVVCSVVSWALVIWKYKTLRSAREGGRQFLDAFDRAEHASDLPELLPSLKPCPHVLVFSAAMQSLRRLRPEPTGRRSAVAGDLPLNAARSPQERLVMDMDHASRNEFTRMHRGMDILASIASATPFIGLFGTVLGIMSTFQVLGSAKSASLNVVAPGIAAALIATAAGLAVAIPAVFAYNWLMARMDEQQEQTEMFIERMTHWLASADALGTQPPAPASGNGAATGQTSPATAAV